MQTTHTLKSVLLDADTLGQDVSLRAFDISQDIDLKVYRSTSANELLDRVTDATVIFTNKVELNRDTLSHCSQLKYIGVLATGMNCIDLNYCNDHNIIVKNVEGYGTASVTQHALMLLLNLSCHSLQQFHQVQQGQWQQSSQFCLQTRGVVELSGKNAVIIGFGELGKQFAKLCQALGMNVIVPSTPGRETSSRPTLEHVLPKADVVSLHCLLSEKTEKLINAERLSLMKTSAILINTSRGGLIDEEALYDALKKNEIRGAGLDVLTQEPPSPDNILLSSGLPNLIITPHWAWGATESRQRLIDIASSHYKNFLKGYRILDSR